MIEESCVSFETAKLLKEAGFNVPCRGVYVTDRTGYYEFREYDNKHQRLHEPDRAYSSLTCGITGNRPH